MPQGYSSHLDLAWHGLRVALFLVVGLLLVATLPRWPHSRTWGYYACGVLGTLLSILLILILLGRI
jgi:Protein of unknown function (DUF3309)